MSNAERLERLKTIITDYQDDHENDKDNPWKKDVDDGIVKIEKMFEGLYDAVRDYGMASQDLGFVQGMQFAMDVMSVHHPLSKVEEQSESDERAKLLSDFIEIMKENQKN